MIRRTLEDLSLKFLKEMFPIFGLDNRPALPNIRLTIKKSNINFTCRLNKIETEIYINTHEQEKNLHVRWLKSEHDLYHELGHYLHDQFHQPLNFTYRSVQELIAELSLVTFLNKYNRTGEYIGINGTYKKDNQNPFIMASYFLYDKAIEILPDLAREESFATTLDIIEKRIKNKETKSYALKALMLNI